jgi:hypothetical protein
MNMDQLVEWEMIGETKILGKNLMVIILSTTSPV